jgi:hypothetical protein
MVQDSGRLGKKATRATWREICGDARGKKRLFRALDAMHAGDDGVGNISMTTRRASSLDSGRF